MNENPHLLFSALSGHAKARPDAPAIVTPERVQTWAQLFNNFERIASALFTANLRVGDRCVIIAGNTIEHVQLTLGIARAGGVVAPMSLMLNRQTLIHLLEDADPKFVFIDQAGRERLGDWFKDGCTVIGLDRVHEFEDFVGSGSGLMPSVPSPYEMFSIIYSSGTTGTPKGILHSHQARSLYGVIFGLEYAMNQNSVVLLTTALYSNASWMLLLPSLFVGAAFVMPSKYSATEVPHYIHQYRISHALLVPTQIADVMRLGKSSLFPEVIISAGSRLEPTLKQQLMEMPGTRLFELYGNTEGVASILRPWELSEAMESVGSAITTGELRILGEDDQELDVGEQGEIVGRSPLMSSGYFQRADLNAELFWRDQDGALFVRSGDLGELAPGGLLFLRGRKKDMIVSGGVNVYPVDIEATLLSHFAIEEVAVVAKAHPRWGETPFAFVVLAGGSNIDTQVLLAWANDVLNKHQRLDGLRIVDNLPRNALGKVVKGDLQKLFEGRDYGG